LHKYGTNQISKKDNHFLLVKAAFKCVVVVLRQVNYYTVSENQLKALLLYVEQDLNSFDKDTMAFTLLKSILDKKLMIPEIHDVLKKVAQISITSESDEKRAATRPIVLTYLMEYPLGKKIDSLIKFFIAQLNYEENSGRESAILMIGLIFRHFPQVIET
jgi:U3 small nucleolar RNA-associated protein 20